MSTTPTNGSCLPKKTQTGNSDTNSSNTGQDSCTPPLFEIVHITGTRNQLYFLTKAASETLHTECAAVADMMQTFAEIVSAEADSFPSQKERDAMLKKRIAWIKDATKMGLVDPRPNVADKTATYGEHYHPPEKSTTSKSCKAQLAQLESEELKVNQALENIRGRSAVSVKRSPINKLRMAHLQVIKPKLLELRELESRGLCKPTSVVEPTNNVDTLVPSGTTGGIEGGITVTELQRFSAPDKLFYLSNKKLRELKENSENGWIPIKLSQETQKLMESLNTATEKSHKTSAKPQTESQQNKTELSDIVDAMIEDFKQQLKPKYDTANLGSLPWFKEAGNLEWESTECHPFNALYQDVFPKKVVKGQLGKDGPVFAASAEAQAFRFAAGANIGEAKWNPMDGEVNLAAKAEAKFSLFEGKIEGSAIFPNEKGQLIYVSFRGADKKERSIEMGYMRFHGKVLMSVFAGVEGTLESSLGGKLYKTSKRKQHNNTTDMEKDSRQLEQEVGAGLLLIPKFEVESQPASRWKGERAVSNGPEPEGNVYANLKGEVFAGAKAGAAVSLAAQWQAPPKPIKDGAKDAPKANEFLDLAKTGVKAGASVGVAAGSHLKIAWEYGKVIVYFRASAAWGLGISGGFETEVDLNNLLTLFEFILKALQRSDYRHLTFVDEQTFLIMSKWLYKVYVFKEEMQLEAIKALFSSLNSVRKEITDWWDERARIEDEAKAIAENIKNGHLAINLETLPPETVGPMLYCLSSTFVFSFE
ncbi:hypothetical protein SAMN03080615_03286 [Amphritea atlantica]|uniref:Uncharacterized protein n=1 Tax=Amphritea atlantica TaxID=355243 RepID=A0A1H9K1K0_9GAMM|nr:hypothetical protein [Amphritea atlantica]SEQ92959.1 hypothetical protein SAMN03080615_03286 [Amphritea atlantica]